MLERQSYDPQDFLRPIRLRAYEMHASGPGFARQRRKSIEVLEDWRRRVERPYVSISGGKDSTAMVSLVREVDSSMPLMHVCSDLCLPVTCEGARRLAEWAGMELRVVRPERDPWEWIESFEGDITSQANDASSELDDLFFFEPIRRHAAEYGSDGYTLGLRAEESKNRRRNRAFNGLLYYNKTHKGWVCTPLGDWKTTDVFAEIVSQGAPLSPIYGQEGILADHMIREGWWLPGLTAAFGSAVWLRRFYPQIWRRLLRVRPEVSVLT